MKNPVLYFVIILFSSLILAIGWVDLSLGSKRVMLGPLGVPVQYSCPERVAGVRGVALEHLESVQNAILEVKKHVQSIEISVDEARGDGAEFVVSVLMNSGNRVESHRKKTDWSRLDTTLAGTIERCVKEFMRLKSKRGEVTGITLTI